MSRQDLLSRLMRLGFAEWEAKVYLALLQHSPATGYQVSKDSGVPRSMVYQVLAKLVDRGAVLSAQDGETTRYAPVPPVELMERLQREHTELTAGLKHDLAQVSQCADEEYVWRIEGYDSVLGRAWKLIEGARDILYAQLRAAEFEGLRPALQEAVKRGVSVHLVTIGAVDLKGAQVVELPVTPEYDEVATFSLLLVADCHQVLLGEHDSTGRARASWTGNHLLAAIVEGHLRRTLLIPLLYHKLGVDRFLDAMPGDERQLMEALLDREKLAPQRKSRIPRR